MAQKFKLCDFWRDFLTQCAKSILLSQHAILMKSFILDSFNFHSKIERQPISKKKMRKLPIKDPFWHENSNFCQSIKDKN